MEHPILFSTPMVQAILDGRKTMTRRVIKDIHSTFNFIKEEDKIYYFERWLEHNEKMQKAEFKCPYGEKFKPSIFMPRSASRITLEITNIRVERLQEITEEDAIKEGIFKSKQYFHSTIHPIKGTYQCWTSGREAFEKLWDSINGKKYPWSSNPWVWCLEFKRVR